MDKHQQKILDELVKRERMTLIGICHECGISRITALNAVNALIQSKCVEAVRVGRTRIYKPMPIDNPQQLKLWN